MANAKSTPAAAKSEPKPEPADGWSESKAVAAVHANFGDINFPVEVTLDPKAIQRSILGRLFKATSLDEAFGVWETSTSDALIGRKVRNVSVRWGAYESDDGTIPLAEVSCIDLDTGEDDSYVTTAANLTGFLAWAESTSHLPFEARIRGDKTNRGFTSLRFERI